MIKNPVKLYNLGMWIGSLYLLLLAIVLMARSNLSFPTYDSLALGAVIGFICLGNNLFYFLGMQKPTADERTRRIGTTAMTYSWFATLAALCLLVALYYSSLLPFVLDAGQIFGALLFTMVASMLAWITWLNLKGDVS